MLSASRLRRLARNLLGSSVAALLVLCLFVFTARTYGNHTSGPYLVVRVVDAITGQGLVASVVVQGPESVAVVTGSTGVAELRLLPGTYAISASKSGYLSQTVTLTVLSGVINRVRFSLNKSTGQSTGDVAGRITDVMTGSEIAAATVAVGSVWSGTADVNGFYRSAQIAPGTYPLTVSAAGYQSVSQSVTVTSGQTTTANFALQSPAPSAQCLWSDLKTWGGSIPGASSNVVIPTATCSTVTLDTDASARSVTVNAGGVLKASTVKDTALTLWAGNFIVHGVADWRTTRKVIVRWTGIDESIFVGGHTMEPLANDPGLWVQGHGKLLVEGQAKLAWTRLAGSAAKDDNHILLAEDPVGWETGDELAIVPTLPPTVPGHYDTYDYPRVAAIAGRDITLDRPLSFDHPAIRVHPDKTMTAEVLNLTRNIVFRGDPGRRAHIIFNMAHAPQTLRYFEVRHMGPQRSPDSAGNVAGVLGRYGIHFHKMGDAARTSLVEGVVLRDLGNHGYVPHGSHGITFRDSIVHNGYQKGFWWDPVGVVGATANWANASHDVLYERCVASRITNIPSYRGFRIAGFALQGGLRNRLLDSVAVGVQGNVDASGVLWPEGESQEPDKNPFGVAYGVWDVRRNVSHNNKVDGWFIWQNTGNVHEVGFGTVIYHNGEFGIDHGAYVNPYIYRQIILYGNKLAGVRLRAVGGIRFYNIHIDQAGLSAFAVLAGHHVLGTFAPTKFIDSLFRGYTTAALGVTFVNSGSSGDKPRADFIELINNIYSGNEVWFGNDIHAESEIRLQYPDGRAFSLKRRDQAGEFFSAAWNASVTRISPIAP